MGLQDAAVHARREPEVVRVDDEPPLANHGEPRAGGVRTPGHQFHLPASCMTAGTSTSRMIVASSSTAAASPNPRSWMTNTRANANAPNTVIMRRAAEVITPAVALRPSIVARSLSPLESNASLMRLRRNTS